MPSTQEPPNSLNENHRRRLMVSCQYVDKLLFDIETVLNQSSSTALFKKYRDDLAPMQRKVTQDYIARIRARLERALDGQNLSLPEADIGAIHAMRTALGFVDIAIEELKPKYMRGYGEIPESAEPELNGIVGELQGLVQKLDSYLAQGSEADLTERLAKLERTSREVELLKTLNRIVDDHGLVEFRQSLSMLAERLEEGTFEIALFGRVSSGKSSLLNRLVGSDLLPVGVNPMTAVPTRIVYGPTPQVKVWFADRPSQRFPTSRLVEFAAEQNNPANSKHVVRIVVEIPSQRLREGVVFVDTPGLGSLATSGAAETLAYLPRCDLGVVLVDAGSTLTQEDVSTIEMLYQAGTPARVLLSKADLLGPADRQRASEYIAAQFNSQLRLKLKVEPVSSMEGHTDLLEHWIVEQLIPLYEQHQLLARASLRRKVGGLRDSVKLALDAMLSRGDNEPGKPNIDVRAVEAEIRREEGEFERARQACQKFGRDFYLLSDSILAQAAANIAEDDIPKTSECSELAAAMLSGIVVERTKPLRETLANATRRLAATLESTAEALGINDTLAPDELTRGIREMPRFEPTLSPVDLNFVALGLFGQSAARRRIETRLREQVKPNFSRALSAYSNLLESWTKRMFDETKRRFSAHADAYRAQLERLSGDSRANLHIEALRRDRAVLDEWEETSHPAGEENHTFDENHRLIVEIG